MKILFHGASVTEQGNETSYFDYLNKLLEKNRANVLIKKKGYGGCHFNGAALVTIGPDLSEEFDFCFLEWNTTWLSRFDESDITHMIGSILKKNVKPVFLILPRADTLDNNRDCESQIIAFSERYRIPLLDLRHLSLGYSIFRDEVHTNLAGAKLYAEHIHDFIFYLSSNNSNYYCDNALPLLINSVKIISRFKSESFSLSENEFFKFFVSAPTFNSKLILKIVRGPCSPVIEIPEIGFKFNVWDEYCHYDRIYYLVVPLKNLQGKDSYLSIKSLDEIIDYSICRRPFSYSGIKVFKVLEIYGIDCNVDF